MKHLYGYVLQLKSARKRSAISVQLSIVKKIFLSVCRRILSGERVLLADVLGLYDAEAVLLLAEEDIAINKAAKHLAAGRLRLRGLYNMLLKENTTCIAVNMPYEIDAQKKEGEKRYISGNIDLVQTARVGAQVDRIVFTSLSTRKVPFSTIEINNGVLPALLRHAADTIAPDIRKKQRIKRAKGDAPRTKVYLLHINSEVIEEIKKEPYYPDKARIASKVMTAIRDRIYYPRVSPKCSFCSYKAICNPKHAGHKEMVMYGLKTKEELLKELKK